MGIANLLIWFINASPDQRAAMSPEKLGIRRSEMMSFMKDIQSNPAMLNGISSPDLVDTLARSSATVKQKRATWEQSREWTADAKARPGRGALALVQKLPAPK